NVTTPELLLTAPLLPAPIDECDVPPAWSACARVTVFPLSGLLFASVTVTVIVEDALPSADTVLGEADTVEAEALIAPALKVTVWVWVIWIESVESVAVKVTASAVLFVAANVTMPELLLTALLLPAPIEACEVPPPASAWASVTVLPEIPLLEPSLS